MSLAQLAIKRPTFIMAILMSVLILGAVSFYELSVRMFPDVEFPYVIIMTEYDGAGVAEIEQLVTKPIEDALSAVSGLKHSGSVSQDNMSVVYGEFELTKNPDVATQEVRDKIGQIRLTLPDDIKEPIIMKADLDSLPIVTMSLKSETMSPKELYDFADETLSKDFAQVGGVSQIQMIGGQKREIQVFANKDKLKEYEINLTQLSNNIRNNTLNIPAGKVDRGAQEIMFRTIGEFQSIKQIDNVVVTFMGNDVPVTVKDVAKVVDGVQDEVSRARLNTKDKDGNTIAEPALLVNIFKQSKGNDVAIADGVKAKIIEMNERYKRYPGKPQVTLISDAARGVRMNLEDVKATIIEGIFLAVVVVYFFLGSWRSTFITALALPNSLIGAFVFMYLFGFSLNVISLMSLSLAVGLLIDDAIVVRENIFRHYEEGSDPIKSAIDGTHEVTMAVIATTSTVIAVFFPVSFLSGIMGKFFMEFGLTIVFAMLISVLDALTIAPMLSAYIIQPHDQKPKKGPAVIMAVAAFWGVVVKIFRALTVVWFNKIFDFVELSYKRLISFIVKKRGMKIITLAIAVLIFVLTLKVAGKYLKTTFMPASEWGEFNIGITAQPGTSLDQMDRYVKEIETVLMNDKNIELVSSSIGSSGNAFTTLSNIATLYVRMVPAKERTMTTTGMKDYLRELFNKKYGNKLEFSFLKQGGLGGGRNEFIIQLTGDDVDTLYEAAHVLMEKYSAIPGFADIQSNYKLGKPELQIRMDTAKMEELGVSSVLAGNEIRAMIDGALSGKYREKGLEYDIRVRLQENQKDIMKDFDSVYVFNINNKLVKLKNVAAKVDTSGPTQIFRWDRARYVSVEGNLATGAAMGEIQKKARQIFNQEKMNPKHSQKWKNIEFKVSGNAEDMADMFKSILIAGAISIIFIFMVLASLYESVISPFTIMSALPLAIIGGILALIITRQPIDMFTMIGMIMLLGIVAKNSILLVDYIQQLMRKGLSIDDSIIKAGTIRLRPIMMTSFALIAGMLPTALGLSEVGQFRKGMGIVVIGGIVSSTILTLIVVPSIFEYMDIIRRFLRRLFGRPEHRMVDLSDQELQAKDLL